ncbi:Predicted nucleotidyltransferase [Pseudobutyrivibrio sp. UC1225]|uniref:tRNA(Met) cytidine acetate ligase n=1 Tax=Pseudobutyrivibrio sp. UC1225 TaxID=1798185 RepID=UPI0008EF3AFA|nr:nucleotidyltransferase family protein [Pseudobutyrivibrio sp. UC1225]SFN46301.1 Predicted nucleotidyltransferase [Pseudobutyrivibrio sp. UC1225]
MIIGIVAEYNPFHNGHKLQIDYAKNVLKADAVVVAMSGSFTQRGEIACFDKYTRAHAALISGADIVFEIPTIFSTASAREFAAASVQLLANTGIVDTILFGAESDDINLFKEAANKLVEFEKSGELDNEISASIALGDSYATARSKALEKHIPSELISNPNNILGLEYCRYIAENKLPLNIAIIKRQGNGYNELALTGEISSASAIRAHLKETELVVAVPEETKAIYEKFKPVCSDDISSILHYKLITEKEYEKYLDCSFDLADRIKNNLKDYISFSQFCDLLKTKNIAYSRISRVLCHILLNITQDDFEEAKASGYINYLRMLGFSKKGAEYLGAVKENGISPLLTSPTDEIDSHDIFAADIYRTILTEKTGMTFPNEFNRKFDLVNI